MNELRTRFLGDGRRSRALPAFALLIATLVGCGARENLADTEPPARPRRLVLIGVDGATWDVIDPMVARGELPNLERLIKEGTRGDLVCLPPLSSPVVWTTFATGRTGRGHYVLDHVFPYVDGPKRAVDSTLRRVPALWNIASHYERTVAVVGYYASHPPEVVNGVMVSDNAARGLKGAIYPPETEERLRPELDRTRDPETVRAIRSRYLPWDYDPGAAERPDDPYRDVTDLVKRRFERQLIYDDYVRQVALRLLPGDSDLSMVYLRTTDHVSHATWIHYDDSTFERAADPRARELLHDVIPTAYRDVDAFLGEVLAAIGDEANLVIVSDHGSGPATGAWTIGNEKLQVLTGNHRPDGVFLAWGPDIAQRRIEGVTTYDVAPTLLALLGLPVSEQLPGHVAEEALRPEFLNRFPIRTTPSYDVSWTRWDPDQPIPDEVEEQTLETLKALGYVEGDTELETAAVAADTDFWSISRRLRIRELIGELFLHLMHDDLAAVDLLLEEVSEHDPDLRRSLPRAARHQLATWQTCFDFPLVSDATLAAFEDRWVAAKH